MLRHSSTLAMPVKVKLPSKIFTILYSVRSSKKLSTLYKSLFLSVNILLDPFLRFCKISSPDPFHLEGTGGPISFSYRSRSIPKDGVLTFRSFCSRLIRRSASSPFLMHSSISSCLTRQLFLAGNTRFHSELLFLPPRERDKCRLMDES